MPYSRPTLSSLRTQVASDITASLTGANALLRKSVLNILSIAQAGLAHLHYGYIDWIAQQAVPWTATDEYAAAWGALKNVFQKPAQAAILTVSFSGPNGTVIDAGTGMTRADGEAYTTQASVTISSGVAVVSVIDSTPSAAGNCAIGTLLTLSIAIPGVNSTGTVTGTTTTGADVETQADFNARMILAYQNPPQGGDLTDYQTWALAVPGVTRAWCSPNGFGPGTVIIRFMMDVSESAYAGFPQGANGVSQYDLGPYGTPRDTVATGDQLTVANAINPLQPVTALVYAVAPIQNAINMTISGLSGTSSATRASILSALSDLLYREGNTTGASIDLSDVEAAINSVIGTEGFLITLLTGTVGSTVTTYTGNITNAIGQLPVMATITYS